MAQTIIVDTTPGYRMPTIYYSQGDIGRTFSIDLQSRFGESLPASPTITIQATKPSGLGFSVASTSISGAVVTFTVTETMSNEAGRFPAELKIVKNSETLFTANFYIDCEANAHPEGTTDGDIEHIMPKFMSVTTTTLPAGDSATYTFDPVTNTANFGIPKGADGSLASQVLAADYSSSKIYAIGDYVYYNGNLYRCTTAITTAEAWTSGHWTQVALGDDVSDLKSNLSESGVLRISGEVPLTVGGYINTSGNIVQTADFSYTDFIDATSINSVYSCMGYNVAVLAYYDENKQFVGYMPTTAGEYVSQWWKLDKPTGTKYVRFSNRKNLSNDDVKIKSIINIDSIVETVDALNEKEKYVSDDIIPNTITLTDEYLGVVNYAGQMIDAQHHSAPILLKKGQTINFTCMSYSVIAPISRLVGGYNRYVVLVLGDENLGVHTYTYTAFEDMYVVLSWYDAYTHTASINEIYSLVDFDERIAQQEEVDYSACVSRVLCIGDSLTAGALFLDSPTNFVGDNAKSYPYFLSKEMNIQCINKGSDGATPEIWFDRLYTATVFDNYDCLLLWLGTNHGLTDTIETDVDAYNDYHDYTNNTGKYCRIIEEFQDRTGNAPVFLIKVFDGGYDADTGVTREITNSVIDKIALKYSLPTIDTSELLYQTPPEGYSDLAIKVHGVNELHFNTYGNMYIAHKFHKAMRAYWKNNTEKMDRPYRLMGNGLPWWMEH